jgi:hypothetical protein
MNLTVKIKMNLMTTKEKMKKRKIATIGRKIPAAPLTMSLVMRPV